MKNLHFTTDSACAGRAVCVCVVVMMAAVLFTGCDVNDMQYYRWLQGSFPEKEFFAIIPHEEGDVLTFVSEANDTAVWSVAEVTDYHRTLMPEDKYSPKCDCPDEEAEEHVILESRRGESLRIWYRTYDRSTIWMEGEYHLEPATYYNSISLDMTRQECSHGVVHKDYECWTAQFTDFLGSLDIIEINGDGDGAAGIAVVVKSGVGLVGYTLDSVVYHRVDD